MDKLLSLLGLARRAGKIEPGFDAAAPAAQSGNAALLLADRAGIPTLRVSAGMEELGRACGVRAGVLALTDPGFARAVQKLAGAPSEEKEEHAHDD